MHSNLFLRYTALITLLTMLPVLGFAQFGSSFSGDFPASVSARILETEQPGLVEIVVTVSVKDGYFTYGLDPLVDPEAFGPVPTSVGFTGDDVFEAVQGTEWVSDEPNIKFDQGFETEVRYHKGSVDFRRNYSVLSTPIDAQTFDGFVMLQVCDDLICLPPKRLPFEVSFGGDAVAEANAITIEAEEVDPQDSITIEDASNEVNEAIDSELVVPAVSNEKGSSTNADALGDMNLFAVAGLAFLAGILSLLTPCVFPMIPITISFFTKRAGKSSKERIILVGAYSGSIVLGFSILGFGLALILSLLGFGSSSAGIMNVFAAHPAVNLSLAIFFVVFAFSLFGAFEIGLPSSWANKIQQKKGNRSDVLGAVMMAMIFVIISFTCTAPIVGPLIVLTVQGGVLLPAIGLTFYAIGFALPFFILGLVPGAISALPKSGGWLNATKVTLGLVELGVALIYFAKADLVLRWGIFTREILLSAWIGISIITALYLLGIFKLKTDDEKEKIGGGRLAFSIVFATLAMYFAFGLFAGRIHSDLEALLPRSLDGKVSIAGNGGDSNYEEPEFIMNDLEKAKALALELNKPLFIDFTGWTCTNCQRNAIDVFPRPEVKELMEQYVLVALYTDDPDTGEEWQAYQNERFETFSLPFYATLTPDDEVIATYGGLIREGQREEFKDFLKLGLAERKVALAD